MLTYKTLLNYPRNGLWHLVKQRFFFWSWRTVILALISMTRRFDVVWNFNWPFDRHVSLTVVSFYQQKCFVLFFSFCSSLFFGLSKKWSNPWWKSWYNRLLPCLWMISSRLAQGNHSTSVCLTQVQKRSQLGLNWLISNKYSFGAWSPHTQCFIC